MNRKEIEEIRNRVACETVLETSGFAIDVKESSRRAQKFRRGSEIIIVTHDGRGWFDPLSDAKGDVFSLVALLDHVGFAEAASRVAAHRGSCPPPSTWKKTMSKSPRASVLTRWEQRKRPEPGSEVWKYLCWTRGLPFSVVREAAREGALREGPYGSMWAAHVNDDGAVTGWEERGPDWRGFSTGGSKILFRLGSSDATRLCVTEAAIDAMSLAAFEGLRDSSLYLSTGGGWAPATEAAVRKLAARPGVVLVAATDANSQGETFAGRLRDIADEVGCDWLRLTPPAEDWNDVLKAREEGKTMRAGRGGLPHARQPHQG